LDVEALDESVADAPVGQVIVNVYLIVTVPVAVVEPGVTLIIDPDELHETPVTPEHCVILRLTTYGADA